MSEENTPPPTLAALLRDPSRLLLVGNTVVLALILFVTTGLMFLLFSLMSDASALQAQARKSEKAVQAMRAEIADLKDKLKALERPVPLAGARNETAPVADPAPPTRARALHPVDVRGVRMQRSCEFRPGNGSGLVSCIRLKT